RSGCEETSAAAAAPTTSPAAPAAACRSAGAARTPGGTSPTPAPCAGATAQRCKGASSTLPRFTQDGLPSPSMVRSDPIHRVSSGPDRINAVTTNGLGSPSYEVSHAALLADLID